MSRRLSRGSLGKWRCCESDCLTVLWPIAALIVFRALFVIPGLAAGERAQLRHKWAGSRAPDQSGRVALAVRVGYAWRVAWLWGVEAVAMAICLSYVYLVIEHRVGGPAALRVLFEAVAR